MLIKEYLSVYFKLDPVLIVGDANLYTLAILSLFFKEQAQEFGLTQGDIDPSSLNKDVWDKKYYKETQKNFRVYLNRFLKPESREKGKTVYFDDPVGRDGFMEFQFHTWLCPVETAAHITHGLAYDDEVADCLTVQELNDVVEGILTFK